MGAAMHIPGDGAQNASCGCGSRAARDSACDDSVARNLGRMVGHIAAAIREPVAVNPVSAAQASVAAAPDRAGTDSIIARRVQRCDAPGPDGTTLRRTVVDEIVAPAPDSTSPRDHHAS
jgi:hypothetical protein